MDRRLGRPALRADRVGTTETVSLVRQMFGMCLGVSENQNEQPTGAPGNSQPSTASRPAETADVAETPPDVDQEVQAIPIGVPTSPEAWRELKRQADEPD